MAMEYKGQLIKSNGVLIEVSFEGETEQDVFKARLIKERYWYRSPATSELLSFKFYDKEAEIKYRKWQKRANMRVL